ncbi:MAG: hypothetical protein CUN55_09980 [Phototrophicales bacterium]|nr:MAG: hypothetical protein CUN55_09980 [Phototrophicales bacterium]
MPQEPSVHHNLPREILVDSEHIGIRVLIPFLGLLGFFSGIVLVNLIQPALGDLVGGWCLALGAGGILSILFVQLGERVIKPLWPSGRYLTLASDGITIHYRNTSKKHLERQFYWHEVDFHSWYWEVETRKTRIPRGWYCVAFRLSTEEHHLIVYAFMPKTEAEALPRFKERFVHLLPKKAREELATTDPRTSATQTRYKQFESQRWFEGAEVSATDFALILEVASI